ncbi:MAG: hypothetical protein HWE14_06955 [Flavobacteriia bacterium]|nr:hypothetical protein [Flavobacteriia bacterium]
MKNLLILFFFTSLSALADYTPTPLYQMILQADKIVYGEIISLDSTSYQFKTEGETIEDREIITVSRFEDWACAQRWSDYAVGQRLLLFLIKHHGKYIAMSAGNEGELPLLGDSVYLDSRSLHRLPPRWPEAIGPDKRKKEGILLTKLYALPDGDYYGYRVSLDEFIQTINTLKQCVKVTETEGWRISAISFACSKDELTELCAHDEVLESLVIQLERRFLNDE